MCICIILRLFIYVYTSIYIYISLYIYTNEVERASGGSFHHAFAIGFCSVFFTLPPHKVFIGANGKNIVFSQKNRPGVVVFKGANHFRFAFFFVFDFCHTCKRFFDVRIFFPKISTWSIGFHRGK